MTKRIAAIAVATAALLIGAAAPANAETCVNFGTFPLFCLDDVIN